MYTYDSLLELDPYVHEQRDRARAETFQRAVLAIVEAHFPALVDYAQQQVARLDQVDILDQLMTRILVAPDEAAARRLLEAATSHEA